MQFLLLVLIVLALLMISAFPGLYANILRRVVRAKNNIKKTNKETK